MTEHPSVEMLGFALKKKKKSDQGRAGKRQTLGEKRPANDKFNMESF